MRNGEVLILILINISKKYYLFIIISLLMKTQASLTQTLLTQGETAQENEKDISVMQSKSKIAGGSSCWQYLFFTWIHPLLTLGAKKKIEVTHMPTLPERYATQAEFNKFYSIWHSMTKSKMEGITLVKTLFKAFKRQWVILFLVLVLLEVLFVAGPILTALSIDYIQNYRDNKAYGALLFSLTFTTTVLCRMSYSHIYYWLSILGINLSNAITMMIFHKSLRYAEQANKEFTEAEIINYSQVDAQKFTYIGYHLSAFFYGPFQFVIGLILMYWILGISFLVGIGIMTLIIILSYFLSKINAKLNEEILKAKDERMKTTQEMLDIIRYIKISAIQKFFYKKVGERRVKEVALYLKMGLFHILTICLYWITAPMLQSMSFLAFVFMGGQITSEIAFTSMMVFGLFEYPLQSLPTAITEIIQIWTSIKRIEKFLFAEEINVEHIEVVLNERDIAIQIKNGNFYWRREEKNKKQEKDSEKTQNAKADSKSKADEIESQGSFVSEITVQNSDSEDQINKKFKQKDEEGKPLYIHALKDIDTKIQKGTFTMILGDIGSGKSSMLLAIINQMMAGDNTKVTVSGEIAYSAQKPWIMSKTVRENITFMGEQNQERLKEVLHFACLEDDLKMLPKGLETEIGEKGITLSGGQKARVSLARSLFSDKGILLLDDILSAVDVHVGEFIVQSTIRKFLQGRTVVMPTHAIKFASFADEIIVMKKGRIIKKGHYNDICNTPEFHEVSIKEHDKEKKQDHSEEKEEEKLQAELTMIKEAMNIKKSSEGESKDDELVTNNELIQELMLPEDHETGSLNIKILKSYAKSNKGLTTLVIIGILTMLVWQAMKTSASIVLQIWCEDPSDDQYYLYIFMSLNLSAVFFIFIRAYALLIAGNNQSKLVHDKMIKGILYADLSNFFNRVPIGRIVNRLTKDLRELDEVVMDYFIYVLISIVELLGGLFICVYAGTPFALIPMIVVGFLANQVRKYYLKTEREASRYEKSTNSPVVSGFMSTISGLATIRAFKMEDSFINSQMKSFDVNKRVRLTKAGLQNWFSMILSFLSFFINMPCIAYCMFSSDTNPSTIGLLMVYALSVSDNVVGIAQSEAGLESKLVSIERIYKFMNIQPEKRYADYCREWSPEEEQGNRVIPTGEVQFRQLRVRYRQDLPDVIKGITCTVKPGQKIGIVGRTGAGKTTIINTLLGVTYISGGNVLIDGKSLLDLPLKALRQSVTMIDQEPTLIKSTFRQNLDPTTSYSDQELQSILKECNLFEIIIEKGGIDSAVSNTSLSAGEKQLLCICRAFLKHSKIVLIDQATANIDARNDSIIQKVISEKFKGSTVFTIAHRLSTLRNSDKIMVMSQGELVEFGSPQQLQNKAGGAYAQMIKKHLQDILK